MYAGYGKAIIVCEHRLHPPEWIGWAFISVGSVLILYSLVLKKPGG